VHISESSYEGRIKVEPFVSNVAEVPAEPEVTCTLPNVLNHTEDGCINNIAAVGWIDMTDTCAGMRQANFDPNVYYARAKSHIKNFDYEIPEGYHWMSRSEYISLFDSSTVSDKNSNTDRAYNDQCGLSGYPISESGVNQILISLNDGNGIHAIHREPTNYTNNNYSHNSYDFLGYMLYKDF
jgi:hypothetical protein